MHTSMDSVQKLHCMRFLFLLAAYKNYSARMSPENTHTLMGFYMEVIILGVIHCVL